jgi:hypothetical protein
MLDYHLATRIQEEYRQERNAVRLVNQAERALIDPNASRPRLEGLRRWRRWLGLALIRLGAGVGGRDISARALR